MRTSVYGFVKDIYAVGDNEGIAMVLDGFDGVVTLMSHEDPINTCTVKLVDSNEIFDIKGSTLYRIRERTSKVPGSDTTDSFYAFDTSKGTYTARFHGWSNGHYAEKADIGFKRNSRPWLDFGYFGGWKSCSPWLLMEKTVLRSWHDIWGTYLLVTNGITEEVVNLTIKNSEYWSVYYHDDAFMNWVITGIGSTVGGKTTTLRLDSRLEQESIALEIDNSIYMSEVRHTEKSLADMLNNFTSTLNMEVAHG